MIRIIENPPEKEWGTLCKRPALDIDALLGIVRPIFNDVAKEGDEAVKRYEEKFSGVKPDSLVVPAEEAAEAWRKLDPQLLDAIQVAYRNIRAFHSAQRREDVTVETMEGVTCKQKSVPIGKVGLYVPGGTAPLFSTALMLAVPAKLAGCGEIVLCSPPGPDGNIHPAILHAAHLGGAGTIIKAGGIQAIAAMTLGTASVPQVYKLFGPGNQYVTAAKLYASLRGTAIDMPAGPSEVEVIADDTADPSFVAADLLSQAEHGVDSQSILVTVSRKLVPEVLHALEKQMQALPRKNIIEQALKNSRIIIFDNLEEVVAFTNMYAPEHLIVQTGQYARLAESIVHAGSIFLGRYTPESAGDYASGTNHTLPTNGLAKAYSGLHLDSFMRKITLQEITAEGLRSLGPSICTMAKYEELEAHRQAVTTRLKQS
ncbi:histidinol dehydrogenase [Bacteroidia bacterium]|nr:histidinol dehydrogenase [Bacteroidia bacterium]